MPNDLIDFPAIPEPPPVIGEKTRRAGTPSAADEPDSWTCPKCGARIDAADTACGRCGYER